ncbi:MULTISPECIES: phage head closure protein [Massilia]|uniref:Phage head closure protein n=1 Tax=Massilia haematophila TaxID=457923 RepID=A0ABV7PGE7_9BURK|nr:phage head closure protein [Massilia sp.]
MFNDRLTFLKPQQGQDAAGQRNPKREWLPIEPGAWGDVRHLRGLETLRADTEISVLRASIRTWYRADVDETMRVAHNGRVYDIKSPPLRNTDRRFMDLVCEAVK